MSLSKTFGRILSLAIFFLGMGWAISYAQLPRARNNQVDGRLYFERIDARVACIFSANHHSPEMREKFQRRELIGSICEAWRYQAAIVASMKGVPRKDMATKDSDVAIGLANEALWLLGFKKANNSTAQEFIAFVEKNLPNNGGNFQPEIHDPASPDRKSFMEFITKALAYDKFKS